MEVTVAFAACFTGPRRKVFQWKFWPLGGGKIANLCACWVLHWLKQEIVLWGNLVILGAGKIFVTLMSITLYNALAQTGNIFLEELQLHWMEVKMSIFNCLHVVYFIDPIRTLFLREI